jgi:hypothetical protein
MYYIYAREGLTKINNGSSNNNDNAKDAWDKIKV